MTKTMFVLISHTMTEQQKEDAVSNLSVGKFVMMPTDGWSQIPAVTESIEPSLLKLKMQLGAQGKPKDVLFVQGDYGATFNMVQYAKEKGMTAVYATSERKVRKVVVGEKTTTVREFRHVRFREY